MNVFKQKKYDPVDKTVLKEYNAIRHKDQYGRLCQAPFTSLRFSQTGNVLACCYNRGYTLGKYPGQSIHDIWFGNKVSELREYISRNDLSLGCSECARRINNRLFNMAGAYQYDDLARKGSENYPAMLDFEISNICNLECVMCIGENSSLIRSKRENLPLVQQQYEQAFVEQLKEFIPYLHEARFSGGEPFLNPMYYDIWDLLIKMNPKASISVLTNGTILNTRVRELLAKGNFNVSVSIDSLNKSTYEKIRCNADYDTVTNNMEFFYNYAREKNTIFNMNVCPMCYNWAEIPSMVRYCNEKNIRLVFHTVVFPPSLSLWALNSGKLKEILALLENEKIDQHHPVGEKNLSAWHQFISQIRGWTETAETREKTKKELIGKNEKVLMELLHQHLSTAHAENASEIISMLYRSYFTEDDRKEIVFNLLAFSPDLIISELAYNEPDNLLQRLKMFNYTTV